ncbi:unnamed protein product, partial [Prorocentrum cordatum]
EAAEAWEVLPAAAEAQARGATGMPALAQAAAGAAAGAAPRAAPKRSAAARPSEARARVGRARRGGGAGLAAAVPARGGAAATVLVLASRLGLGPPARVSAVLGSVASVTESASSVMSSGFQAASSMTSSASTFFLGVTKSPQSTSQEAWRGVGVYSVSVTAWQRRAVADDGDVLVSWLEDSMGDAVLVLSSSEKAVLTQAALPLTLRQPLIAGSNRALSWPGSFRVFNIEAVILDAGHSGI